MKIALTTKKYFPILGGSVIFASMLAEAFTLLGHDVRLLTRTPGNDSPGPFPVLRCPSPSERKELAAWADVVLQVDSSWQDVWPFLLKRRSWFPTIHRGKPSYLGFGLRAALLLAFEETAYRLGNTISVSSYAKNSWAINAQVIPNPYDERQFHPPGTNLNRDIDLLFVGRIVRDKGVFVLLEAIEEMISAKETGAIKKVAFIGSGPMEESLKREAGKRLQGVAVEFPGQLPPAQVAQWMRRSRTLAFPTTPEWLEASPLTPLEAAACGCWVVASDIGGTVENIPPEHWLVEAGSISALKKALSEALQKPNDDQHSSTLAFLKSRHLKATAEAYITLFQQTLNR